MILPQRLSKFVHDTARLSGRQVQAAHDDGQLTIVSAGAAPRAPVSLDELVYEDDEIRLAGQCLQRPREHYYAVLNKPSKILSVPQDPRNKGDLGSWLETMPPGSFAVGRLDRETTGALLFTTDGDLANGLLRPERHADKVYHLLLGAKLGADDERLKALVEGFDVGPFFAKAKQVQWLQTVGSQTRLALTLDEGKHRQIRRMCRTLKLPLRALHRHSVGPVSVSGMPEGTLRELTVPETETLWATAGGRLRLLQERLEALRSRAMRHSKQGRPDLRLGAWLNSSS